MSVEILAATSISHGSCFARIWVVSFSACDFSKLSLVWLPLGVLLMPRVGESIKSVKLVPGARVCLSMAQVSKPKGT